MKLAASLWQPTLDAVCRLLGGLHFIDPVVVSRGKDIVHATLSGLFCGHGSFLGMQVLLLRLQWRVLEARHL